MYNDYSNASRTGWNFNWKGSELLPKAQAKLQVNADKEAAARKTVTTLVSDPGVERNDMRVTQANQDIQTYGNLAEQDRVFVMQFAREPDREYQLSLGDVVYFGLI